MSKYTLLKDKYDSPRISGELLDCSMPMSFDSYSVCGYSCAYCFSYFQRSINQNKENYFAKKVKVASIDKFKRMFTDPDKFGGNFKELIKDRITLQWGGLSDPFCLVEQDLKLGLEFLKFLKEIEYPVCFSSKSDLLIKPEGKEYLKLFEGSKNWSYKASIITLDAEKAKKIEAGCPSPQDRLKVLKTLSDMGIWTILRLRPFIYGLSNLDYEELIKQAAEAGIKAMSTEFFCLEIRNINVGKANYDLLSKVVGFDIVQFYKNLSTGIGYLRLNYEFKAPYFNRMKELCDQYGVNFHVSDAHGKDKGCSGSCCGLPQDESISKFSHCQFTNALHIAKITGKVHWSDIAKNGEYLKNHFYEINGLTSLGKNGKGEYYTNMNMFEIMRNIWNNPNTAKSPYKYFGGVLYPVGTDANNDVIYEYRPKN